MNNKTYVSPAIKEIVDSVKTLCTAGRYPRKGWKYEVAEMMNDAKLVKDVSSLNELKSAYCTWCKKCNHDLCMDNAPVSCKVARTYEKRLRVLCDCEVAKGSLGKLPESKKRKEYETDQLHNLFRQANTWFTKHSEIFTRVSKNDEEFELKGYYKHFVERNFGALKSAMEADGRFGRGRKKASEFSEIHKTLCKIIKEVF